MGIGKLESEKQIKTRGRTPTEYAQLDLTDPEQLALALLKTMPRK